MNLFRTLSATALVCLTAAGLDSCISAPDYDIVPEIEFKELTVGRSRPGGGSLSTDTLKFAVDYRDGDGDLGLSSNDIQNAPYNSKTGGPNNRGYSFNYFIQLYLKEPSGRFVAFNPGGVAGEYDGTYPRLEKSFNPDAKPGPIRGTLRYKLPIFLDGVIFKPGQVFRAEISIMDRALRQSNKVTTSEVTLGQ
ncbi:hypothetical protein [Hymenobacter sp. B1770]|uniref:hypothetical protein n=1 Tax=Hymenobacter sp. B1770 TaxID=1718788 RepID=UPI003CE9A891